MDLKYARGTVGQIIYLGRQVKVWSYKTIEDLYKEVQQLGHVLDQDSIAWVGAKELIYQDKIVAKTTPNGQITWLDKAIPWGLVARSYKEEPQTLRGKYKEVAEVESLWKNAVRTDWEAIMVKTSW